MIIKDSIYKKGNHWFKKLIDLYKKENLYVKYVPNKNYVRIYFRTPILDYLLTDVPLILTPYNTFKYVGDEMIQNINVYNMASERGILDKLSHKTIKVLGFIGHKSVIDRRLFLLRNNQEFIDTAKQNAKALVESRE